MRLRTAQVLSALGAIAIALLAASAAPATVLCKEPEESCKRVNTYPAHVLHSQATNTVITTSLGKITCTASHLEGETTKEEAEPLPGEVTGLSFEGCKLGEGACTLASIHLPYAASIKWTKEDDGTVIVSNGGHGLPAVKTECAGGINCTYTAEKTELSGKGGNPGEIVANQELKREAGFLCPATAKWSANYVVEVPEPVHVAKNVQGTKLCAVAPNNVGGVLQCPEGKAFAGALAAKIPSGSLATFKSIKGPKGTVSCSEAPMSVELNSDGTAKGAGLGLEFNTAEGACAASGFAGGVELVSAVLDQQPFEHAAIEYVQASAPQGLIWFTRAGTPLSLILGIGAEECFYSASSTNGSVTNPNGIVSTRFLMTANWKLELGAEAICPTEVSSEWPLEATKNLWVAHA